ncbi:MAG: glycosyltransferase, partial [Thermoproteota archaeon]
PLKQIFKKLYKKVKESTVISSSTYSRYMLLRRLGLDSRVIYPPVDVEHFKWNGEEKRNIAVMAGRISREKKYEQVIMSLDKMNIDMLIILGLSQDNEYLTYLKGLAMQLDVPLEILLDLPREKYIHILRMAKIYIHACTNEAFGITVPEAMAAGCIPIVPNTGGPAEIVPRELQYGGFDELVEKVNREVENPSFRPGELYSISLKFSKERFYENIKSVITEMIL